MLHQYKTTHTIDGKPATSPTTAPIVNPTTGEVFAHVPVATNEQLEETIAAAERAVPAWSAKTWDQREDALVALAALAGQHADQFAELIMREGGKDRMSTGFEISSAIPWIPKFAKHRLQEEVSTDDALGRVSTIRYRPYGVCAAIVAFNFPFGLCVLKMTHALLAGNCLIIKVPPTCPCAALKLVELAQSIFPPGVLSVLYGGNDLGQRIVQHPRIMRISFTGSTTAGKAIMREAAAELKSITLELGGNDPAIVFPDVDVKKVAQHLFIGATGNGGQACFGIKRLFIHEDIYEAVRDELVVLAKGAKVGDPFDKDTFIGPMQNPALQDKLKYVLSQLDRAMWDWTITDMNRGLLADCKSNGYKIAFEGTVSDESGKGYFIPITVVDNPPDDARIVREEQFGPIIPLLKWRDEEDVVARANNSEYGFGSTIWGTDMERIRRVAEKLYFGMVWINEWATVSPELPLTGTKLKLLPIRQHSGVGVESSKHGLASWVYIQAFVCKQSIN
uniref:Glucans biosynthesis glucosyltransferase H (EC) n=1 Tax=Ganoderma boninense TaxID=34458 RepID=A0A5K1K4X3_9APHY|nr:Glucans biosynthesis glucosyltransferase H (EC [Ganoderma boninense]